MSFAGQIKGRAATLWHVQRVKKLVREWIEVGPLSLITVVEVECDEPNCPGPATHVTILNPVGTRWSFVVHKPVCAVRVADVKSILAALNQVSGSTHQ